MTTDFDFSQLTLHTYESLATKSQAMLEAARRNDWQAVIAIERDCDQLMRRLHCADNTVPLDQNARARRAELMHRIVATDAAVREISQPWANPLARRLGLSGRPAGNNLRGGSA